MKVKDFLELFSDLLNEIGLSKLKVEKFTKTGSLKNAKV